MIISWLASFLAGLFFILLCLIDNGCDHDKPTQRGIFNPVVFDHPRNLLSCTCLMVCLFTSAVISLPFR